MRQDAARKSHLVDSDDRDTALALLELLFAPTDTAEYVVLHGDAVPGNVLLARDGLRVIDPRPSIGEQAYDAGYWATFSGYGHGCTRERLAARPEPSPR